MISVMDVGDPAMVLEPFRCNGVTSVKNFESRLRTLQDWKMVTTKFKST
jgi:hypothetical protein